MMRGISGSLCALLLALAFPVAAPAQSTQESRYWERHGDRISFTTARISFPTRLEGLSLSQASEFSHAGEGIDSGLQFKSADEQVFATVYVYYPGLPHSGLTAFATDWAIRTQSSEALRQLASSSVSAGGRATTAIRNDYAGYRDGLASSAAFIRAGRWIIKLRISGPEARRQEVEAAMTTLLAGIRFEGDVQPETAAPLEVSSCVHPGDEQARPLPDDSGMVLNDAMIPLLETGSEMREGRQVPARLPERFGPRWCRSSRARIGQSTFDFMRSTDTSQRGLSGRTVMFVSMNDAGKVLEVVESRDNRYVLLFHEIGQSAVLGAYESVPGDDQVADILSGSDREAGRFRATVRHRPSGDSDVNLLVPVSPEPAD